MDFFIQGLFCNLTYINTLINEFYVHNSETYLWCGDEGATLLGLYVAGFHELEISPKSNVPLEIFQGGYLRECNN